MQEVSINTMKISVIIPSYKPKGYLWECLGSLVKQTFPRNDFEVIIVLNGCCNPWKSDIDEYISTRMIGMNVNFIQTDVPGVSNARNIAIDNAKGEFITFIDDDDYVSPNYLSRMYEKANNNIIVLCKPIAFDDNTGKEVGYGKTQLFEKYSDCKFIKFNKVRQYFSGPCMKLIPINFIQDRRFDTRFSNGEDSLFMFQISDKFSKVAFANANAVYYRRFREGSALSNQTRISDKLRNSRRMINVYFKYYFNNPFHYSFSFLTTRILGALKSIVH